MNRQDFGSALRALVSLDVEDLTAAGLSLTTIEVRRFETNPAAFFLRSSDERAAVLWRLAVGRTRLGATASLQAAE